jgi:hypothetical protein
MEDIINILDNRINIVEEIAKDDTRIEHFIKEQLQNIINNGSMQEVLMAHIHPLIIVERLPIVEEKIFQILNN